ncbi:PaaI family thioesterase [Propioniciclava coleopterorum]|uniref:Acyl-coenzyme A thioesterase THEM4 n=1 Tax=Propioniciclava coleopterorum TaxID=2714937 RepID=A0A6G7Y747_9ACTN|nr:PaaI family thioesterase [Propioniciclava coleopterorum]QIK72613.1 PaaI family thioesterase [Propioniciclava coleopterorum]
MSTLEHINGRLAASEFYASMGLVATDLAPDRLELRATLGAPYIVGGEQGFVHGGILATLLDLTGDWALFGAGMAPGPTVTLTVNYLRPVPAGAVRCVGEVLRLGRRHAFCRASILAEDGTLLCFGEGVYVPAAAPEEP